MSSSFMFAVAAALFGVMAFFYALATQRKLDRLTEELKRTGAIPRDFDFEDEGLE